MFPISDVHGRIVAFSGRILDPPPGEVQREGQDPPAKYVNSPEGPLYKKGELLFGLHEARVELRREGTGILCEGNFDVLALHQAGCKNVVAPLGTAFTAMQARLLRKYVGKITLVFDGDRAGRKAVANAYPLLMGEALAAKVATLPPGEDPDSFLRGRGADALKSLVANGTPIVEHLIESAAAEAGADPAARAQAIETLGPILKAVPNPVEIQLWIERIAQTFQIHDIDAVRRQLRRGLRAGPGERRAPAAPVTAPDTRAAPVGPLPTTAQAWAGVDQTEKDSVVACLDQPSLFGSSEAEKLDALLTSDDLRVILRTASSMVDTRGAIDASTLLASAGSILNWASHAHSSRTSYSDGPDGRAHSDGPAYSDGPVRSDGMTSDGGQRTTAPVRTWLEERLSVQTFDESGAKTFLSTAIRHLSKRRIEREIRALDPLIKQAFRDGDSERATELMRRKEELYRIGGAH